MNANKKQQQQQREKQQKKKKKTNSHYPREKTYQAFIHSCCQLIDLKRTLLLNAIKKKFNYNNSHPYQEIIYSFSEHTVTVLFIKDMCSSNRNCCIFVKFEFALGGLFT